MPVETTSLKRDKERVKEDGAVVGGSLVFRWAN